MRGRETPTPSCPQSPLRITHDGEFYARLLTKESSLANPSFRYYGAGPAAVPFGWESQPGTPKDASCRALPAAAVVPAITPPPSYHLRTPGSSRRHGGSGRQHGRRSKGAPAPSGDKSCKCCCGYKRPLEWIKLGFLAAVFRRIALGRSRVSTSSPSSSAASVQSSSSSTRWLFSGGSSSCLEETGAHHYQYYEAPAMTGMLCLSVRPSPWMVKFCGGRREPVWVQGWP
ncbi:hypothetical protein D1007_57706 [Hordeum vulgare]|uniref:Uncharacterized protein n=1 Tax=Hordeum vulgare subsp. vulgare TaxID=112509 RepID=A0A8I6WS95_HORVV|nr:uncharacterized protein LOC123414084 [Hordeum vulgare subsp. vulgare]KAE8770506.1 hypothetical protein D1007_57706 [Hordeum vulgare]